MESIWTEGLAAVIHARRDIGEGRPELTTIQLWAAWALYKEGLSSNKLADAGWRVWGFNSASAARNYLLSSWRGLGLKPRDRSETKKMNSQACIGCGCKLDERTRNCASCRSRHNHLKEKGQLYKRPKCARCGCHFNKRTSGCSVCTQRHLNRKYRKLHYIDVEGKHHNRFKPVGPRLEDVA